MLRRLVTVVPLSFEQCEHLGAGFHGVKDQQRPVGTNLVEGRDSGLEASPRRIVPTMSGGPAHDHPVCRVVLPPGHHRQPGAVLKLVWAPGTAGTSASHDLRSRRETRRRGPWLFAMRPHPNVVRWWS